MNWSLIAHQAGWSSLQHHAQQHKVKIKTVALATGAAAVGAGVYHCTASKPFRTAKLKLPRPVFEAFFGAVGEIAQVAVLYPLDTLKVRCQASGCGVAAILKDMLRNGITISVMQQLYAGVVSASICSVAIGSLYYLTFCAAQRLATTFAEAKTKKQALAPHVLHDHHDMVLHGLAVPTEERVERNSGGKLSSNLLAAVVAALVGALIEAPVELFKNQTKAGLIEGNMLRNMANTLKINGLRSWYWGFLPFCFKSLPFDVAELLTWSQLRDWYDGIKDWKAQQSMTSTGHPLTPTELWLVNNLPEQVWDAVIGAAAGAAAVCVSMPSDCVKTVMDTRASEASLGGGMGSIRAFFSTGKRLMVKEGPGALFTGVMPRLGEKVPSTMLYWVAVESCRRLLEPFVDNGEV